MQQAMDLKELRDVYVPVQLINRKTSALLDRGCNSSIIGARLLPPGIHVEPTLHALQTANGSAIPVEVVTKVTFCIGTQEFTIHAVVTKAVHEMILWIDFLIDAGVDWRFGPGKIKLGMEWIRLCQCETSKDVCKVYVCADCVVPHGAQAEVPVEISRPTWCAGPDFWAIEPIEILERVVVARTLFDAEVLRSFVRVLNLTDELYHVRKEQLFGTASKVEVFGPISQSVQEGEGLKVNAVKRAAPFKITQDDVRCLFETLPTELSEGQRAEITEHIEYKILLQLIFCRRIRKCFQKASLIWGKLILWTIRLRHLIVVL